MTRLTIDAPEAVLDAAIETNMNAYWRLLSRDIPNARIQEEEDLTRFETGIPFFLMNGVLQSRLSPQNLESRIGETLAYFRARQLPMMWLVGPTTRPADLGRHLEAQGLVQVFTMRGMAVDLQNVPESEPLPADVEIKEVSDRETLAQWTHALSTGFPLEREIAEVFATASARSGFGAHLPIRNFVALWKGEPVASSTLCLDEDVAGIYCVATVPTARRQGIAAAMTATPLRVAHALGYQVGILQASEMGESVYHRLGFRDYSELSLYMGEAA